MTWLRQLRHVLGKDALHGAVLIVLYAALVALLVLLTPVVAKEPAGYPSVLQPTGLGSTLVLMVAALIVAIAVQDDSPVRSGAFWRITPLRSSAVLAAKFAGAGVLTLIIVAGQSIILLQEHVFFGLLSSVLMWNAVGVSVFFAAVSVMAYATEDLRTFFLSILAVPVGIGIVALSWPDTIPVPGPAALAVASIVIACVIFLGVERIPRVARRALAVGMAGCVTMAFLTRHSSSAPEKEVPASVARLPLQLRSNPFPADTTRMRSGMSAAMTSTSDGETMSSMALPLSIDVPGAPRSERRMLLNGTVTVTLKDGSKIESPAAGWDMVLSQGDSVPHSFPVWLTRHCRGESDSRLSIMVTARQRMRLKQGFRSVHLEGDVMVAVPRVDAELPIGGREVSTEAGRARVTGYSHARDVALISTRSVTSVRSRMPVFQSAMPHERECAVINTRTHHAISIDNIAGGGSRVLGFGLPGATINRADRDLRVPLSAIRSDPGYTSDEAWFKHAKVAVIGWDLLGKYRASGGMEFPK